MINIEEKHLNLTKLLIVTTETLLLIIQLRHEIMLD